MRYRLAAIDLDETLLGPDKRISAENAAAVRALIDRGVEVVLASGRRYENMIRYARELELKGPMITTQGASAVMIETRAALYESPLSGDDAKLAVQTGLSRGLTVLAYYPEATYANRRNELTDLYDRRSGDSGVVLADLSGLSGTVMKVLWLAEPHEIPGHAAWAAENFPQMHTVPTDPEYLELMDWHANKREALTAVGAHLGVARDEVAAFGDGNNDASMLEWAGLGVAMAHGTSEALRAADVVGPEGDPETALARSIEHFMPS